MAQTREPARSSLPFPDGEFDIALCQSAMFFFPDPAQALREMVRGVSHDGVVAVQVFSELEVPIEGHLIAARKDS